MAVSGITVTPGAVIDAAKRIGALCEQTSAMHGDAQMWASRGEGADSFRELSDQVAVLTEAVHGLLLRDQQRLYDGVIAFEGTDSELARMIAELRGF